jgi:hypothetical protein
MSKSTRIWMTVAVLAAGAHAVRADSWDVNTQNDNAAATTENELMHGSNQVHDLGALGGVADVDHYRIGQRPYSSWEVVVDATSADLNDAAAGLLLQRVDATGATVLQGASPVTSTLNFNQSLRWQNTSGSAVADQLIRVSSSSCTTGCGTDDVYRIRAFETTYSIARFNNSSGQTTVVLVQNTAPYAVAGTLYFWNASGGLITSYAFSLAPKALAVVTAGTVPGIADQAGSVTLSNTGRYGDLSGKAVALEPATGYAFDTPLVHRAN